MEDLISAIYDNSSASRLQTLLQSHSLELLQQQDSDGLNVLHHAILANNQHVIPLLQEMGFTFTAPLTKNGASKGSLDYLHLACLVYDSCFVETLCQLQDGAVSVSCHGKCWPKLEVLKSCLRRARNFSLSDEELDMWALAYETVQSSSGNTLSPVDVAAMFYNFPSLQILLNVGTSKSGSKKLSMLEQTVELKSIVAFRFLLERGGAKPTEVNSALKSVLSRKLIEFLRILLDRGVDIERALGGINPYHFMFLLSSQHQGPRIRNPEELSLRNKGLVEVTTFLFERGFSVNAPLPIGTYPLYSLVMAIILEKDNNPTKVPIYHIDALETILRLGADPNFDEVSYLKELGESPESVAYMGRELSTSVLNCYFLCLQSCDTWRPHIMEHLDRLCLTLLESGADADYVDPNGSTPLHDLMQAMATQHSIGHMHADLSTMTRMLLYFGANPNRRNRREGEYPVECYFSDILCSMGGLLAFRRWKDSNIIPQVLNLLYFMDAPDANEAYHRILKSLANAGTNGNMREAGDAMDDGDSDEDSNANRRPVSVPDDLQGYVSSLMHEFVCNPKSLQELTRLVLWKAVSRKVQNLRKLRMPKAFLASIKDLFALDV